MQGLKLGLHFNQPAITVRLDVRKRLDHTWTRTPICGPILIMTLALRGAELLRAQEIHPKFFKKLYIINLIIKLFIRIKLNSNGLMI